MIATDTVELLLVEDNPQDLEPALRKANPSHRIQVVRDDAEALEFFSARMRVPPA